MINTRKEIVDVCMKEGYKLKFTCICGASLEGRQKSCFICRRDRNRAIALKNKKPYLRKIKVKKIVIKRVKKIKEVLTFEKWEDIYVNKKFTEMALNSR